MNPFNSENGPFRGSWRPNVVDIEYDSDDLSWLWQYIPRTKLKEPMLGNNGSDNVQAQSELTEPKKVIGGDEQPSQDLP